MRNSVNGILVPVNSDLVITDEYLGHFLQVSYTQEISSKHVFSKDRVDVDPKGNFRFFLPVEDLVTDEAVTIEVFGPDGGMIGRQRYAYGALWASAEPPTSDDETDPLRIEVDPCIVNFNESYPVREQYRKLTGRLVDLSGDRMAAGAQIVIYTKKYEDSEAFQPIFTAKTNKEGYFYGRTDCWECHEAYAVVAGLTDYKIIVPVDDRIIPEYMLLTMDLSLLPKPESDCGCGCGGDVPSLPDSTELVGNAAFSQDVGGGCVDFSVPNRTLEEYSFYHTVRTTEPEIRGLTISSSESKQLKSELLQISDEMFTLLDRLNSSMSTMDFSVYSIESTEIPPAVESLPPAEDEGASEAEPMSVRSMNRARNSWSDAVVTAAEAVANMIAADEEGDGPKRRTDEEYAAILGLKPKETESGYQLKLDTDEGPVSFNTRDLERHNRYDMIQLLATQSKKKARLQALHYELAMAYCGKNGAPQAKTYCESLMDNGSINAEAIRSVLGHIEKYTDDPDEVFIGGTSLADDVKDYVKAVEHLLRQKYVDATSVSQAMRRTENLIKNIDNKTRESQDQEELLGYLRRLMTELVDAKAGGLYNFESCTPKKTPTMGIMCMMNQYEEIRNKLRNTAILSLGEIIEIRTNYDIYVASISSFIQLLDKFYKFYRSSRSFLVAIEDDYFVKNYHSIRMSLSNMKRRIFSAINYIEAMETAYINNHPGRKELCVENSIDWDLTPTIYENTTIAHGHILHFKQKWKADGYSLGDLLYSLPLAPCQEKQIAIVDWDREERGARTESDSVFESLQADISRDRDISEILSSSFTEDIYAKSYNKTRGTSAGIGGGIFGSIGGAIGGLFGGVSHSGGSSKSSTSQNSARNLSGSTMNRLQDNVSQAASSVRSRRSTVVQSVGQDENVTVQTEVVKNHNHCHAVTIEYFEVLKHYAVEQELVDVQECLFVPLPMSSFDYGKILRWEHTLKRAVYGSDFRKGFDAINRITTDYADSELPEESYCDDVMKEITGYLNISFDLERPRIAKIDNETKTETYDLEVRFPWFGIKWVETIEREVPLTEQEKDAIFEADYAPQIAQKFIDLIQVYAIDASGNEHRLDMDFTMNSEYRKGRYIRVNFSTKTPPTLTRRQIEHIRVSAGTEVKAMSKIVLRSLHMYYRTDHFRSVICANSNVHNDIVASREGKWYQYPFYRKISDAALLYTPLNHREKRNPRKEDQRCARALQSYLNENMELAHKAIWAGMDNSRLFGLLDGYIAPNAKGRSVASVVENRIMGIVGNNLVLKVIPGERLDPIFRNVKDLTNYYKPTTKPDPYRISVPTKGVYAESVLGKCNSCEEIDETRFWRFNEVPCGTSPTPIQPVSSDSRRADPGDLTSAGFPNSIINMQTAPTAPDPTGLGAAMNLLGKSDVFKDMTGLAGTQANAAQAMQTTSESVTALAGMAADVMKHQDMKKDIGKTLKTIQAAEQNKQISSKQANALAEKALSSLVGEPSAKQEKKLTQGSEVKKLVNNAAANPGAEVKVSSGDEVVEVSNPPVPDVSFLGASSQANYVRSYLQSRVPVSAELSASRSNSVNEVLAFMSRTESLKFNFTRQDVFQDMLDLINRPDELNQGDLNLCGPAATVRSMLYKDPFVVIQCVIDLLETGKGELGSRELTPDDDLINQTWKEAWRCGPAAWVLMSSMRDDANWFYDYEGTPDEDVSAATMPGEIVDWLEDSGIYTSVEDVSNLVVEKGIEHATSLEMNATTDHILLIHAGMLESEDPDIRYITDSFPNHWVMLDQPFVHRNGRVTGRVWSWGTLYNVDVTERVFERNYYGAVIAKTE